MSLEKSGEYLKLRGEKLDNIDGIDIDKLNELARFCRGYIFASLEASKSGHPGGSSSKVEQLLSLITSGVMSFDFTDPKNNGRDRVVWSAGHCTPLLYGMQALMYETLSKKGIVFDKKKTHAVMGQDLLRFRHFDGPQGHVESYSPLADLSTGASGHGISGAAGLAALHSSCGLDAMKTWVLMGDAESEEGMTYEARNVANSLGLKNLVVMLDRNHFGIDGDTDEVISSPYINHWLGLGWNVIEVDGHNILELMHAYQKVKEGFNNQSPTVILSYCIKGKCYGCNENSSDSHGKPADTTEYISIMKNLGFEVTSDVSSDIEVITSQLSSELVDYLSDRLAITKSNIISEQELINKMQTALVGREFKSVTNVSRPDTLPEELVYSADKPAATRKATDAFFKWLMSESAFFYAGTGDLSKSILTWQAEQVHGILNRTNKMGRGIRFGIAEQNMAMLSCAMTQDILPGGYQASSVFSSYGVFTSMMANSVRMTLIGNHVNPDRKGFFIMLAAHDGLETGEDGPTHHGLYWMSLFNAYPGIKVYKPLDANETVEMLFHALKKGEPIALSVARPDTIVFDRTGDIPPACEACNGAYIFKPYKENGKAKMVLAVCGGQTMANTLEIVPELEENHDVKIIAVTSPELYEELKKNDPAKAEAILSDEERLKVIAIHNGWKGFLYPFILSGDYASRSLGTDDYYRSGPPAEVYAVAKLTAQDIKEKILKINL
ncbi:MAG: 1-deoxy-D-xylulose-5-phosphate synthase N-terminal domain-containing protein [Patescibacteria group bacterium]